MATKKNPKGPSTGPVTPGGGNPGGHDPGNPTTPPPVGRLGCRGLELRAEATIVRRCQNKTMTVPSAHPCGGAATGSGLVDLVIIIDTSGSMNDEATGLSSAAAAAIKQAQQNCPSDLRVTWLGIEGTWPATNFSQSVHAYLGGIGVPVASLVSTPGDQEDGAAAVDDIAQHFDWRAGASKLIFFLGDEGLEKGDPQDAADVTANDAAINHCKASGVRVFTYAGTGIQPASVPEYARLANETGGTPFVNPVASLGGFGAVLEKIICAGTETGCQPVKLPALRPCLTLKWGDGPKDQLETEDFEVLCISAHNPYTNVILKDLTIIAISVVKGTGDPVPLLPDGTPSVLLVPSAMICFGDLLPCDPQRPNGGVAREVALKTVGALEGPYTLRLRLCFHVEIVELVDDSFTIELVPS